MDYYSIAKLSYSNFKYVPAGSTATFEFPTPDFIGSLMILNGPNGYGKTTLFDAIELLLTGDIKAFKADLKSRGKDNYSILANDPQKPMSFAADFQSKDGAVLHVKRVFSFTPEGDCTNSLTIDGKSTDSNELQKILKFNQSLFDLGIYISQRESLSFLQNKYKTRGQEIAEIIDVSFIKKRIDLLQDIKNLLTGKWQEFQSPLLKKKDTLKESIQKFQQQIDAQKTTDAQPKYERLFSDFEYNFDKENIDINCSFDSIIETVENLKNFSENYVSYKNECFNQLIDKLLNWDQDEYFALYNRRFINIVKEKTKELDDLNFIQRATSNLKEGKIPLCCRAAYKDLGVPDSDIEILDDLTTQVQVAEMNLGVREASLQKIIDSRTRFLSTYMESRGTAGLAENACPLCGTRLDNLLEAVKIAEDQLRRDSSTLQKELRVLKEKQKKAANSIIEYFENVLSRNQTLLFLHKNFERVKDLNTVQLEKALNKIGINSFENNKPEYNLDDFKQALTELMQKLAEMRRPHTINLSRSKMGQYQELHNRFYHGKDVYHTTEDFQNKIDYISYQYGLKSRKEIQSLKDSLEKVESRLTRLDAFYKDKISTISMLTDKCKLAQRKYNDAIQRALKLPIYIFSGKIIQNYPLGLGIVAEIDNTKIVLKPQGKDDDVYNVLSAGQLNGLALSVLLAVHTVYGKLSGLNLLLIDDPLQTIDEISAISLTDLLTDQLNQGQIMISTHEEQKAKLFQYKFLQSGYKVKNLNMQGFYLEQ